jgi:hypothetical protein
MIWWKPSVGMMGRLSGNWAGICKEKLDSPGQESKREVNQTTCVALMDDLLLQFRDNGKAHDDLHLWLEGYSRTADSYYLALDPEFRPSDETPDKVRHVLLRLLESWMSALPQATGAHPAYLPYDFSDEYTGYLCCRPEDGFIDVAPGWSNRAGWSVCPSNPGDYFFGITDFHRDAPSPLRLAQDELLRQINDSIVEIKTQLYPA